MRVDAGDRRLTGNVGSNLELQLRQGFGARARNRLIGVHDNPFDSDGVTDCHQHRHELHRGAVGVGDDALVPLAVVGVHLTDDEWDVGLHPPRVGVVDDRGSARGRLGRQLARNVRAGGEKRDVNIFECFGRGLPHRQGPTIGTHGGSSRSAGGKQAKLADRKVPFGEDLDHRSPDDAGGTDYRDGQREGFSGHDSTLIG